LAAPVSSRTAPGILAGSILKDTGLRRTQAGVRDDPVSVLAALVASVGLDPALFASNVSLLGVTVASGNAHRIMAELVPIAIWGALYGFSRFSEARMRRTAAVNRIDVE